MNQETKTVIETLIALAKEIEMSRGKKRREAHLTRQKYILSLNGATIRGVTKC